MSIADLLAKKAAQEQANKPPESKAVTGIQSSIPDDVAQSTPSEKQNQPPIPDTAQYKGECFYRERVHQLILKGGRTFKPDAAGVYDPKDDAEALEMLHYLAKTGLVTPLKNME